MAGTNLPTEATPLLNRSGLEEGHLHEIQAAWKIERIAQETQCTLPTTLLYSYSNLLLFCAPLGIAAAELGWSPAAAFTPNFVAMLPLASIITFPIEQLAA